jgi:alkylation response protein AidB-like acyl-CoA dehydrogenase
VEIPFIKTSATCSAWPRTCGAPRRWCLRPVREHDHEPEPGRERGGERGGGRDVRILGIGGGTNEILNEIIAKRLSL